MTAPTSSRTTAPTHRAPVRVQPRIQELEGSDFDPLLLLAALRKQDPGRCDAALFETADQDPERPHRTILVLRAWCRVVLRDGVLTVTALSPDAEPLVKDLTRAVDQAFADAESPTPGLEADERMVEPSVLDGLRLAATAVQDRRLGALLPPGLFGALSYELVDHFEQLPERRPDPLGDPDASFVLAGDVLVRDHLTGRLQLVTRGLPWEAERDLDERHERNLALVRGARVRPESPGSDGSMIPGPARPDVDDATFLRQVRDLRAAIGRGEVFQAVLSRGLAMESRAEPLEVYRALRRRNPSPHMFFLELGPGAGCLLGASPETFLRHEEGELEVRPIAGTAPRGRTADGRIDHDLDARLALAMQLDPKELAEHAMLLDLARNDLARVCEPGSVRLVEQLAVERYSHVQHLVSRLRGRLRSSLDALHAYRATANMGTLTGAPKARAMELVREAEPEGRGFYGGAAGYLLADGRLQTCIVIRSLRYRDGIYRTRAGAGVVWDSVPERELQETEHKSLAVRHAIAEAEEVSR